MNHWQQWLKTTMANRQISCKQLGRKAGLATRRVRDLRDDWDWPSIEEIDKISHALFGGES